MAEVDPRVFPIADEVLTNQVRGKPPRPDSNVFTDFDNMLA